MTDLYTELTTRGQTYDTTSDGRVWVSWDTRGRVRQYGTLNHTHHTVLAKTVSQIVAELGTFVGGGMLHSLGTLIQGGAPVDEDGAVARALAEAEDISIARARATVKVLRELGWGPKA